MDGSTTVFHNLLHRHGLTKCQHDRMYTFQSHSDASQQSRIDYIIGPDHIMSQSYQYQEWTVLSDHSALILREKVWTDRGPELWCLSDDLLDDPVIEQEIGTILDSNLDGNDPQLWWESLKLQVRETAQYFAQFQKVQRTQEIHSLQKLLREVNTRLYKGEDVLLDQQKLQQ